jgi:methionyl-tRNA formyltransferase
LSAPCQASSCAAGLGGPNMRILVAGTPDAAVPSLELLAGSRHEVVGVVTRPDAPAGRGRRFSPSSVAVAAVRLGLPVLKPASVRDPAFLATLADLAPECGAVIAYGAMLPGQVLGAIPHGWVNLHFSLLPAWRGAAPVQHSILAGEDLTGATVFRLVAELDAGPVIGAMTYAMGPRATAGEVLGGLADGGARLLVDALDAIEAGVASPRAQEGRVTLAPKLSSRDGRVDWAEPWFAIDRRIRACTPAPGGWTMFRGRRLGLGVMRMPDSEPGLEDSLPAGELVVTRSGVWVGTGTSAALLGQVRPEGKGWMDAGAWARGIRPRQGERVGVEA